MDGYTFYDDFKPLRNLKTIEGQYHFVVINYEQARIHIDELQNWEWDFCILDESHRAKNRRAKTSKAVWQLNWIKYKLILSGTPITKDEIDLWSQFKFLNPSIWGSNFNLFEQKALKKINMGDYWVHKPHRKKIKPFMLKANAFTYRVRLDEIAELPGRQDIPVLLSMKRDARKAYTELESGFLTEYQGKRSSIDLSAVGLTRLAQLTGGHLILENGDAIRFKDQPKLWWILDKLEDIGKEKLLVICRFTYEIELIASALKKLGYKYEVMKGGMKPQEVKRVRRSFQDPKGCQILLGQVSVVKEGNNFQHCCRYTVFYSKSLSYVDIKQCKDRTYRNGQRRKVLYWHLIIENTIDEAIEGMIESKYVNAERVLRQFIQQRRTTMTKEATKTKKTAKKNNLPKVEAPEFGIAALAKAMGIEERSVRVKLRNAEIERDGKFYDFKNKEGVAKMAKKLSPAAKKDA